MESYIRGSRELLSEKHCVRSTGGELTGRLVQSAGMHILKEILLLTARPCQRLFGLSAFPPTEKQRNSPSG